MKVIYKEITRSQKDQILMVSRCRPVASGGAGGALAPPVFVQTVNPISTRGADYTHHSTTSPPGFSDLATGLSHTAYV